MERAPLKRSECLAEGSYDHRDGALDIKLAFCLNILILFSIV